MSVSRRGKSWQVRWVNASGKRCSRTFARKADAEEYERTQKSMARRFEVHDPSKSRVTVRELYPRWIATKTNRKPKTVQGYESTWRNVVEPRWGDSQLRSITMAEVKVWAANCSSTTGKTLGATKAREAYFVLCMILDFAIEDGLIVKNPARPSTGTTKSFLPTVPDGTDRNYLDEDELEAVAEEAGHYRDLIILLGTLGLRFGEACGLKGGDVDLKANIIHVRRTLSDVRGQIIEQPPKNGISREVPLPEYLRERLRQRKLRAGEEGYIFTTPDGSVIRHSNFSRRVWKPILQRVGIKKYVRIHDLRGTAASWLISRGASVIDVSKMLGHKDPSITLKRYARLVDEASKRLRKSMDREGRRFA